MRTSRKLLLGGGGLLAVLLLLLVVLPYLFRDRIVARVQAQIAQSVDARVQWDDVGLSLLRDFPNATVRLDDVLVTGVAPFDGDTLVAARQLRVVLDLGSVVRFVRRGEAIVVREVALQRPVANLVVLADGRASWDVVREQPGADTTAGGALALSLRELVIEEGRLRYDDRQTDVAATLAELELALDGDFTQDAFDLGARLRAGSVSLHMAGVPYLSGVALALDTDVAADMRARRFTFTDDTLRLNHLLLAFGGSVGLGDSTTALDLRFAAPSTDIGGLLSLVPALYANDFERLRTAGRMSLSGTVKGDYGASAFPALALRAQVQDGSFQYPDLPLPARDIALDLAVDNPGGHVDRTVLTLERFHVVLGGRPLDARLVLRTPLSDPDVDLRVRGSVDLADLPRTVKLQEVQQLAGMVNADVALRTRRSWVDAGQYERVAAAGTVDVSRMMLQAEAIPHAVAVDSARLRFTPRHVELASFAAKIGSSDVRATGTLDNLLGFVLRDEELRGQATVASDRFDLNEWRSDDSSSVVPVPPNVDFTLRATAGEVRYGDLTLADARGGLHVKDRRVTIDDFGMRMLGGHVTASGFYETIDVARPTFDMQLAVDSVDVPTAFAQLVTVQRLAPVARWVRGSVSANLDLAGALGADMTPVFSLLTGDGGIAAPRLAIEGFPVFVRLADALRIDQLRNPTLQAIQASFHIQDGRVALRPFDVRVGDVALTIAGSGGVDQTLDLDLALAVPTSLLGNDASRAITTLASRAGRAGLDLGDAAVVSIGVDVTGTVTDPVVRPAFTGTAGSLREGVQQAVQTEIDRRVDAVEQRVDSAAEEARRRARAEADRLVAEAEEQAARLRTEADSLAARIRREAGERADTLEARASNPAARLAARAAADRLRREADSQAERIVREATERGDALVAEARRRGDALVPPPGG